MRYSVVILTFGDRLPALRRCINKVKQGAATPYYEIIVVNNGSEEIDAIHEGKVNPTFMGARYIYRPTNEGVCARNYGIEVAVGDYIIQVDDDVQVVPGFDNILLPPMDANPHIGATGPHGFYQDSSWGLLIDDRRRPAAGQACDLVMGYCWAWRNEQIIASAAPDLASGNEDDEVQVTNCYWPRFLYDWDFSPFWHEESDLQLQIRAAGYRIMATPPVATHNTLHDWGETHRDGPMTGLSIAERNFYKLVEKWKGRDFPFEGPLVGLRGPAPGRRIIA